MPFVKGIDVSAMQGPGFNWDLARQDDVAFAIVKATQGPGFVDSQFKINRDGAHRVGMTVGVYHVINSAVDGALQADHCMRAIGALRIDELPIAIDHETKNGVTPAQSIDSACKFAERIKSLTGRPCLYYTYPTFWQWLGNQNPIELTSLPLWIAHYRVDPQTGVSYPLARPAVPAPWQGRWHIWQTSGNRGPRIPGINVDVDRNEATSEDISALVSSRVTPPAPSQEADTVPEVPHALSAQPLEIERAEDFVKKLVGPEGE